MSDKFRPSLLILNQMAGPMTWELAEDLGKEFGHVALLTGHPDTLAKGDTPEVKQYRAPAYKRGSIPVRTFTWVAYVLRAFFWLWRWPANTPVLLFSNPPILCWLGWLMSMLRDQRYAVMVHDIYPNILINLRGVSEKKPFIRLWFWLNRLAYERARVVMTLGEYMAANLESRFDPGKTPAGKVEVIYPWVDTERIRPIPKEDNWFARKYGQVDKLTVMYSGNMGIGHDIDLLLNAVKQLKDESEIHFLLIGDGPKRIMINQFIETNELDNATLLDWQKEEDISFSLPTADVAIISIKNGVQGAAFPSKVAYHMAAGSAILIIGPSGLELEKLLEIHDAGKYLQLDDDENSLAVAISELKKCGLINRYKQNARQTAVDYLSRKLCSKILTANLKRWILTCN